MLVTLDSTQLTSTSEMRASGLILLTLEYPFAKYVEHPLITSLIQFSPLRVST